MDSQEEFIYDPELNVIPSTPGKKINKKIFIYIFIK
jgi:hypothetical protein